MKEVENSILNALKGLISALYSNNFNYTKLFLTPLRIEFLIWDLKILFIINNNTLMVCFGIIIVIVIIIFTIKILIK